MRSLRSLTNEIRLKQEIKHKYRSNRRKTSYLYMQDREEVVYDAFLPTNSSPLPLKHHMRTREIQKGNIHFLCHPDALKQKNIEGRLLGCKSVTVIIRKELGPISELFIWIQARQSRCRIN